ncbi:MAG: PDZ domain-containing protein [Planctomycetes bacterium]|nr:PDZ domain-containing protein [Planctomycetota bacterium]
MPRLPRCFALTAALAVTFATAAPASAQHVRKMAERAQAAVVALDHRVGRGGGFLNNQRSAGENILDSRARTTGFVISADGHVVTHARFVQGRDRIRLYFHGGAKGWAKVVGIDPVNRTALLKLEKPRAIAARFGGTLPSLSWGDSTSLAPGNTVFSLGNCFDSLRLDGQASFSQGVVTTIQRSRLGTYRGPLLETDASINPGSFGGPLLNAKGEVIGVITRNISTRRWLGGAIPAEQVKRGINRLIAGRPLSKGLLGVALERTGGEAALKGLRVSRVVGDSGAAIAGVAVGDFLLAIDGQRVYDTHDVARELGNLPSGAVVQARVRRGSATRNIRIVLGDGADVTALAKRPTPKPRPRPTPKRAPTAAKSKVSLGLRVQERENGPGLEVIEVRPNGTAAAAGVKKGDVLVAVGRQRIRTGDDLGRILARYRPGQKAQLMVIRERRARRLTLNFGGPSAARPSPIRPSPRPRRATLGVRVQERANGAPGLEVIEVRPNTAAAKGGVRVGDVILRWANFKIRTMDDLGSAMARLKTAGATQMHLLRAGKQISVRLPSLSGVPTPLAKRPRLGLQVEAGESGRGLMVIAVAPNSIAAKAGFRKGDLLIAIARKRTATLDALGAVLRGLKAGQRVVAVVIRDGGAKRIAFAWSQSTSRPTRPTPTRPTPTRPTPSAAQGYLGVYLPDSNGTGAGVLIEGAVVGSPADAAGLRSGDRILSVDGRSVSSKEQLGKSLRSKRAGSTVALMVARGTRQLGLKIVLGERGKKTPPQPKTRPTPTPSAGGGAWLGASIQDGPSGILVAELSPRGPLAKAGLRKGDLIKSMNGQRLTTVDQFAGLFSRYRPGQRVTLEVERDGWSKSVKVQLGRRP